MAISDPQAVQRFQMAEALIRRQLEADDDLLAVCRRCGRLEYPGSTWDSIASAAQRHADTSGRGHLVAVTFWQGAVFRPNTSSNTEEL